MQFVKLDLILDWDNKRLITVLLWLLRLTAEKNLKFCLHTLSFLLQNYEITLLLSQLHEFQQKLPSCLAFIFSIFLLSFLSSMRCLLLRLYKIYLLSLLLMSIKKWSISAYQLVPFFNCSYSFLLRTSPQLCLLINWHQLIWALITHLSDFNLLIIHNVFRHGSKFTSCDASNQPQHSIRGDQWNFTNFKVGQWNS